MAMQRCVSLLFLICCLATCSSRRRRVRPVYGMVQVRLQGGTQPFAGRVQVFYRGIWGGVCENAWSKENADVVCRQLGYKGVLIVTKGDFYGLQTGPTRAHRRIWLDQVKCQGHERHLGECQHKPWGRIRCNRLRLAGVRCDPGVEALIKLPPLAKVTKHLDIKLFEIKLLSKQTHGIVNEGLLVVKYGSGKFGGVCTDGWDIRDAQVACGELGFTQARMPYSTKSQNDLGTMGFNLSNVECTGNEASLLSCHSSGIGDIDCKSGLPVWLKCNTVTPSFEHVRLRGGIYPWEGRVDVRSKINWLTLCDKYMDIYTANVICRSLGYGTAYEYTLGRVFPKGVSTGIYERIQCTGTERSLQYCRWKLVDKRKKTCRHYSDSGVKCNAPKSKSNTLNIRLTGGPRDLLGTVAVEIHGKRGVICGDHWTMKNAMVVCRQLGLGYAAKYFSHDLYGRNGETLMSGTTCFGNETSLDQCLHHSLVTNVTCSSVKRVAGVECKKDAPDLAWDTAVLGKTMDVHYVGLPALQCAQSENCLASSATRAFKSYNIWRIQRRLLRFSAMVHNVGTAAYRPYQSKNLWKWHSCHRHYHSDEEFALYDLINEKHQKVAEGHKASYCLEDTNCDEGVQKFYRCENGGDQGVSVNCHDNYVRTLDCQWVDIDDLDYTPPQPYMLRVIVNPSFKVAESDYSNNVALCPLVDYGSYVYRKKKCFLEICESGVRSHRGNGNFACCKFPFIYDGKPHSTCIEQKDTRQFWCSTTSNYDKDKLWGFC